MVYTIYIHINKINNKCYVGATRLSIEKRWRKHIKDAKVGRDLYFHRAILKYGKDSWEHNILEICETIEEADKAETKWIAHYKSDNREFGYNIMPGGLINRPHSEETKQKISEKVKEYILNNPEDVKNYKIKKQQWHKENKNPFLGKPLKEETKNKISEKVKEWHKTHDNPFLGKTHTDETIEKISKSSKEWYKNNPHPLAGKTPSEETKKKMRETRSITTPPRYNKEEFIEISNICNSFAEIARHLNYSFPGVTYLARKYNLYDKLSKKFLNNKEIKDNYIKNEILDNYKLCKNKKELACKLNISEAHFNYHLEKFNLKEVINNYYYPGIVKLKNISKEELIEIAKQHKNMTDMAKFLNIAQHTVKNYLDKYNIDYFTLLEQEKENIIKNQIIKAYELYDTKTEILEYLKLYNIADVDYYIKKYNLNVKKLKRYNKNIADINKLTKEDFIDLIKISKHRTDLARKIKTETKNIDSYLKVHGLNFDEIKNMK